MKPMRDARLKRALDSAPDDEQRPSGRTRDAVLAAARRAVEPAPSRESWWASWWRASGSQRMPWSAALATVVVATLVTVLWHDREVPGARTEAPAVDQAMPALPASPEQPVRQAPPAAKLPEQAPVTAAAPQAPSRSRKQAATAATRGAPQPSMEQAKAVPSPAERPAADELRPQAQGQAESAAGSAMRDRADTALAKSAPPAAPAAALAPAPAPAPAPTPAPAAAPRFSVAAEAPTSPAAIATELRIVGPAKTVDTPLAHPSPLADLLERVIGDTRPGGTLEAPIAARVELRRQGELLGTLEVAGAQVRWVPARGGTPEARMGQPHAPVLQDLKTELGRVTPR